VWVITRDNNRPGVSLSWLACAGGIHVVGARAGLPQHDCIKAFSETDFTEDLRRIEVPTLVMHGDDDQIVPNRRFGTEFDKTAEAWDGKVYEGLGHGMCTINADVINADLLAFIQA
jgi:non-heme chloroperoxidase